MSGSRLISAFGLLVIFCQISTILSHSFVPVLIFGGDTPESSQSVSALGRISNNEFAEVVSKKVGGSRAPIVVFAKYNLCVEELSQQRMNLDTSTLNYYPAVDSPLTTFEDLASYNISKDEKPESISDGHLIIVPLSELGEVPDIYTELRSKSPKLIGVITAASCSYSRSERTRRAVSRADGELIAQADRVLLYSTTGIQHKTGTGEYISLGEPTAKSSVANESHSLRFDLAFENATLRLQFTATLTNYWYFESIEYEADSTPIPLYSDTKIFFPYNFSYHCTKDIVFYNGTTYVFFDDIQVQIDPTTLSVDNGTAVFSDGYDCIGFTNIPIWSGLFVTAILALIIIWGLTMIMDIRTMDRFDDPKGKTITIAVSE